MADSDTEGPAEEARREEEDDDDVIVDDVEVYPEELAATAGDYSIDEFVDSEMRQGQTNNPNEAIEDGVSYSPPSDPAVMGSDEPESVEVATGFAPSMEEADPDVNELPAHVDNNDLEIKQDVQEALRNNSETANLDDIRVRVVDGVVYLHGNVLDGDDVGEVYAIVSELEGVRQVVSRISVGE